MAGRSQILLITNKADTTADLVVVEARKRDIRLFRLNTEELGRVQCTFYGCDGRFVLSTVDRHIEIDSTTGVYFRRPTRPCVEREHPLTAEWVAEQWKDYVWGMESVPNVRWMSQPFALQRAENKIHQLMLAKKVGFKIPPTIVTNEIDSFHRFRHEVDSVVAKALGTGLVAADRESSFIYTTAITPSNEPVDNDLTLAPVVFQENMAPARHYRVTVVGPRVFSVRLEFEESVLDWRLSAKPPKLIHAALPKNVENAARNLVQEAGLSFSSMDLMVRDGDYFFLDLNPNGEWAWLERTGGIPIAATIVDYLARENVAQRYRSSTRPAIGTD